MYAHQVIEDLKGCNPSKPIPQLHMKLQESLNLIRNAQCFHLDDMQSFIDMFGNNYIKELAFHDIKYLKLPYQTMWLDMHINLKSYDSILKKIGFLINEVDQGIFEIIQFFNAYDDQFERRDVWAMDFTTFLVDTKSCSEKRIFYKSLADIEELMDSVGIDNKLLCESAKNGVSALQEVSFSKIIIVDCFLHLLNCKNITTETIKAPEALNKKRRKNGKQEIFDYHVLNVTVPSRKGEYREKTEPLSHVRVHLCRGHFKEYTEEHPLFGRLTGLYWWQPHVRGQNKDGIVIKDYKIKTQEAKYGQIGRP